MRKNQHCKLSWLFGWLTGFQCTHNVGICSYYSSFYILIRATESKLKEHKKRERKRDRENNHEKSPKKIVIGLRIEEYSLRHGCVCVYVVFCHLDLFFC